MYSNEGLCDEKIIQETQCDSFIHFYTGGFKDEVELYIPSTLVSPKTIYLKPYKFV